MNSYTPGPWFAEDWSKDGGPNTFTIAFHELETLGPGQSSIWLNGIRHGRIASTEEGEGDRIANARLIATAPRLLAALQVLVACGGGTWHHERYTREHERALTEARAAIAEATQH